MKAVAAWIADPADQALASHQLARVADVRCHRGEAALVAAVAEGQAAAVVISLGEREGPAVASAITAMTAHVPRLPIVLWGSPSRTTIRRFRQALATGACITCAPKENGALPRVVAAVLQPGWEPGPMAEHIERYAPLVPSPLDLFIVVCAARPSWQLDLEKVAIWMGMSTRTLRDRFHRTGLATPRIIHHYLLALHAAWLLIEREAMPKQVADALDFTSVNTLNDLFNALTGMPAGAFRERGALSDLRQRCENVIRGIESPYAEERPVAPRVGAAGRRRAPARRRYTRPTLKANGPIGPALLAELHALFPEFRSRYEPPSGPD